MRTHRETLFLGILIANILFWISGFFIGRTSKEPAYYEIIPEERVFIKNDTIIEIKRDTIAQLYFIYDYASE